MIVTHARTGSSRRVTANGNATSSLRAEIELDVTGRRGPLDEHRQHPKPPRADDDVNGCAALQERRALLLRHAACDGDERPVPRPPFEFAELSKARVQLLLGALPDAARVDHDHVGLVVFRRALVSRRFEQSGHLLGVVVVHLAAERLDPIFPAHFRPFAFCVSLSPFARLSLSP